MFVASRIREPHDRGVPNPQAVSHRLPASTGVGTSARVIMVAVFGPKPANQLAAVASGAN
jgi:hypothetical protein